jgi:hypothetical protein
VELKRKEREEVNKSDKKREENRLASDRLEAEQSRREEAGKWEVAEQWGALEGRERRRPRSIDRFLQLSSDLERHCRDPVTESPVESVAEEEVAGLATSASEVALELGSRARSKLAIDPRRSLEVEREDSAEEVE